MNLDQRVLPGMLVPVDAENQGPTSRIGDHHTAVAAGLRDLGRRGNQRERIALAFLSAGGDGCTDEEACRAAGVLPQYAHQRCSELRAWGYIEYAKEDRMTVTGSAAKVWTLTGQGAAALIERTAEQVAP